MRIVAIGAVKVDRSASGIGKVSEEQPCPTSMARPSACALNTASLTAGSSPSSRYASVARSSVRGFASGPSALT